jgi:2-(1,2-epoxy-1,2-dihydrophenyl)acetyl-CoA isomerase
MSDTLFEMREDGIAWITLNRPESLNAMGGELMPLLGSYLADCAKDPAVRCVVLTGAGRAFCAGGDVKGMASRNQAGAPASTSVAGSFARTVEDLRQRQRQTSLLLHTMPRPTIAAINGFAMGAGLSLALSTDLRVCSEQAKLGTAFRNVGLSGDFGGSYFMTKLAGAGVARELYLSGEVIDAPRALELGLVNRVVPHDELEEETMALARQIASGPSLALARMKENLNLAESSDLAALLDQEALNMRLSGLTDDHREAAQAFVEKRQPVFRGR